MVTFSGNCNVNVYESGAHHVVQAGGSSSGKRGGGGKRGGNGGNGNGHRVSKALQKRRCWICGSDKHEKQQCPRYKGKKKAIENHVNETAHADVEELIESEAHKANQEAQNKDADAEKPNDDTQNEGDGDEGRMEQ